MEMSPQFKDTKGFVSLESEITTEKITLFSKNMWEIDLGNQGHTMCNSGPGTEHHDSP